MDSHRRVDKMYKTMKHGEKAAKSARNMNCEASWGWTILIFIGITILIMCLI